MIYKCCLPQPIQLPEAGKDEKPGIWFYKKKKNHRRTVEYLPAMDEMLYTHAKNGHEISDHLPPSDRKSNGKKTSQHALSILSACKQTYEEAAPMLYSQNLVFACPDALFNFTVHLSLRSAKLVRSIEIRTWGMTRSLLTRGYGAMAMLAAKGVTELQSLYINCMMGYFGYRTDVSLMVAKKVYRDCHVWIEAVGASSGQRNKAVDILEINLSVYRRSGHWDHGATASAEDADRHAKGMTAFRKELLRLVEEGS